jgi:hypothetical protein
MTSTKFISYWGTLVLICLTWSVLWQGCRKVYCHTILNARFSFLWPLQASRRLRPNSVCNWQLLTTIGHALRVISFISLFGCDMRLLAHNTLLSLCYLFTEPDFVGGQGKYDCLLPIRNRRSRFGARAGQARTDYWT